MSVKYNQKVLGPAAGVVLVLLLVFLFGAFKTVGSGYVGVVTHFGAVQDEVLDEGFHFKMPIMTNIQMVNVRVKKMEAKAVASSRDLQAVTSHVALNYQIDSSKANVVYQNLGRSYEETVIAPAVQEAMKKTTAEYTAEALITKRSIVKEAIFAELKSRLETNNIIVTDFSIINFDFSRKFNDAIEAKQVAEQAAQRAKNDLVRIEIEAKQKQAKAVGEAQAVLAMERANAEAELIRAKAKAESQRLLNETLTENVLALRKIEKWDGVLPKFVTDGGQGMMFNVPDAGK